MKHSLALFGLASTAALLFTASAQAQSTYHGNGSTGFGPQIGNSTLTVSDDASTGLITFNFGGGGNDVAFYFSTGSAGVADTSLITDTSSESTRTISGAGTNGNHSVLTFAPGFNAGYAVAVTGDSAGDVGTLYSISTAGALTMISSVNEAKPSTGGFTFSLNSTSIGLAAGSGAALNFVASLGNGGDGGNPGTNYYRSNETFGPSNADNNGIGNPGGTGGITFTGSDLFTLSTSPTGVPEPTTCVMVLGGIGALVGSKFRRRRI